MPHRLHAWDVSPAQARAIQTRLAHHVIREDDFENIRYVAGADIDFEDNNRTTRAAVAVLELRDLNEVEAEGLGAFAEAVEGALSLALVIGGSGLFAVGRAVAEHAVEDDGEFACGWR